MNKEFAFEYILQMTRSNSLCRLNPFSNSDSIGPCFLLIDKLNPSKKFYLRASNSFFDTDLCPAPS